MASEDIVNLVWVTGVQSKVTLRQLMEHKSRVLMQGMQLRNRNRGSVSGREESTTYRISNKEATVQAAQVELVR